MVEFQENIICGRLLIKFPTKFLKNNMGEVKIEFQENNIRGRIFCAKSVVAQDISDQIF